MTKPARNLIAPLGGRCCASFLEKCDKVSCFFGNCYKVSCRKENWHSESPSPSMRVASIQSRFFKTRVFWKFKTLKSRFIFCFSARLFFQSRSVTNPINCHVANLRRAKPRFFNRQERETTDNAGWKRLDFFGSFHGFSFNPALIFAVFR